MLFRSVNRELDEVTSLLERVVPMLRPGGRLVVISFHSLEDRLVKRFMRRMAEGDPVPAGVPIRDNERNRVLKLIGRAQRAGEAELAENPRARSAVMRVAERLAA